MAPSLFSGRVVSVNDAVLDEVPWRHVHPAVEVVNPELKDPATTFVSRAALLRDEGLAVALWNPYVAAGQIGLAAWSYGLLSPTVFPAIFLPEARFLNGVLLIKLVLAFVGMFLLLRERRLQQDAAAVGAVVFALSGPVATQWLWSSGSTAVALPWLLWTIDRSRRVQRWSRRVMLATAGWALFATGGDPGATAIGAGAAALWWVSLLILEPEHRAFGLRTVSAHLPAVCLVGAILLPAILLSPHSTDTPGMLDGIGTDAARLVVDPFAFGDPRRLTWEPPATWADSRHADSCLAPGWVALALAAVGCVGRRRDLWVWITAAVLVPLTLALTPLLATLSHLPGAPGPATVTPLFALAVGALAAIGATQLQAIAPPTLRWPGVLLVAAAIVTQQGMTAVHLLSYLPPDEATPQPTTGIQWLQEHAAAHHDRIVPLFSTLWPDLPQRFGLRDVRSHDPQPSYRSWMQTIDSQAWGHWGSAVILNGATIDLDHPYLRVLGGRFLVEPPDLQVVAYTLGNSTVELGPRTARVGPVATSDTVVQQLELPNGCSRIAVHAARANPERPVDGAVQVTLTDVDDGTSLGSWTLDAAELVEQGLAWIDLTTTPAAGHRHLLALSFVLDTGRLTLRATQRDMVPGSLLWNDSAQPGDLGLSFDVSGFARVYSGSDLQVWENRNALPPAWLVQRIVPGDLDTVLAAEPPFDLANVAVVPTEVASEIDGQLEMGDQSATVDSTSHGRRWRFQTSSASSSVLATSIRWAPHLWRLTVDGEPGVPFLANGLFVGVFLPAGEHTVELWPQIPNSWWLPPAVALSALLLIALGAARPARHGTTST